MTYRVTMLVGPPERTITTRFAGCEDEADAKRKARKYYPVIVFKKIEPILEDR